MWSKNATEVEMWVRHEENTLFTVLKTVTPVPKIDSSKKTKQPTVGPISARIQCTRMRDSFRLHFPYQTSLQQSRVGSAQLSSNPPRSAHYK